MDYFFNCGMCHIHRHGAGHSGKLAADVGGALRHGGQLEGMEGEMTIEEARRSRGLSRNDIVKWLGIPYRTLQNWENGERKCPPYIEKLIVEKILAGEMGDATG